MQSLHGNDDFAGPGIGTYEEVEKILPTGYGSLLDREEAQKAIFAAKRNIHVLD